MEVAIAGSPARCRAAGWPSRSLWCLATAAAALASSSSAAFELGNADSLASVEVHGFATQGFIWTTENNYIDASTLHGSFQLSEVGLNFTKSLTDSLSLGVQFFAQDLGPNGNYTPRIDWFYVDYRWRDWLGLRAGRVQIPYGLYNEIQDVDSARNPVLLPQSVYPLQNRTDLFAQTGAELHGFFRLGPAGALDYRAFLGTIFLDPSFLIPPGEQLQVTFNVPYVGGGQFFWETPLEGLRVGGSVEALRLDTTAYIPTISPIHIQSNAILWLASAEYALHNWTLAAEYGRGHTNQHSDFPALSPPTTAVAEAGYVMASYRAARWLQPGLYYAVQFPNVFDRQGRANFQHDIAGTLRFDINAHWLVKLEAHWMDGTAGLVSPLNVDGPNISQSPQVWAAFFATTTAYF